MFKQSILINVLTVLVSLYSATVLSYGTPDENTVAVSLISLIANPEKYHDQKIRVIGVANLERDGQVLCLSKSDLQYLVMQQCVYIYFDLNALGISDKKALLQYNGKYILAEGIFNQHDNLPDKLMSKKNNDGLRITMGSKINSVTNITRYQLWETP